MQYNPEAGNRFDVLYESPDGTIEGFVTYGIKDQLVVRPRARPPRR